MKQPQAQQDAESRHSLRGIVERLVFHNEENGWTVMRMKVQSKADPVAVVGVIHAPQPGMSVQVTGVWVNDARYGRQFRMETYELLLPATVEGIRHYLGSGLIKGIGKRMAERIVTEFGEDTFRVLDEEPDLLVRVKGISPRKVSDIKAAWATHSGIRDLIMFLQPHGISTAYAVRIFRHYGPEALEIVRENPYRLAMDIRGIGFVTADAAALKLGFAPDSELRVEAGLLYVLGRLTDEGNVFFPLEDLVHRTADELGVEAALVRLALAHLEAEERVVVENVSEGDRKDEGGRFQAVYLARLHRYEVGIARFLLRVAGSPKSTRFENPEKLLRGVLGALPIELAEEQVEAARAALHRKVLVITGGPGTGKTTIINAVIRLFEHKGAKILLAAPTGRAAKRMAETSGREAATIHRLLEYSPGEDCFGRNEDNPLACGLLVIDEASMLDTMLMCQLMKAVPLGATLVFVGDVNQLPSVGPGNVLKDVISAADLMEREGQGGGMCVARLTQVFRQAAESEIIVNAHRINHGETPPLSHSSERLSDFYFMRREEPEAAAEAIVDLVKNHIPRRFGLHPVDDIQVLTPMHKGSAGVTELNMRLQEALNPGKESLRRGERQYRLDDKVMQLRNNYDKDVFNGDMGRICWLDSAERELTVRFDGRNVLYSFDELDEIIPAYAISVHKSQGSEYPAVVMPILMQHYMLLQRNLLYTGVTRGKRLVMLIGSPKAVHMAVKNNKPQRRYTWLGQRLAGGAG